MSIYLNFLHALNLLIKKYFLKKSKLNYLTTELSSATYIGETFGVVSPLANFDSLISNRTSELLSSSEDEYESRELLPRCYTGRCLFLDRTAVAPPLGGRCAAFRMHSRSTPPVTHRLDNPLFQKATKTNLKINSLFSPLSLIKSSSIFKVPL